MEEVTNIDEALYYDIPDNLFHIRDPEYPSNPEKDGVLIRARERLGENRYGITYNNCEHFVRFVICYLSVFWGGGLIPDVVCPKLQQSL